MLNVKYKVSNNKNCLCALTTNNQDTPPPTKKKPKRKQKLETELFSVYITDVYRNITQAFFTFHLN